MTKEDLPVGKSNNKKQGETGGSLKSIPENSEQFSNPKSADIWAGIKSAGSHNVFSLLSEAVYQLSERRFPSIFKMVTINQTGKKDIG